MVYEKDVRKTQAYTIGHHEERGRGHVGERREEIGATLPLKGDYVHTPDVALVNKKDKSVIPLQSVGGTAKVNAQMSRTPKPTLVTVVFDKFEKLDRALFGGSLPGQAVLSHPEDITVVNKDRIRVIVWHDNQLGADVELGFTVAGPATLTSKTGPSVAPGKNPTFRASGRDEGKVKWGGVLPNGKYGGFVWEFEVSGVDGSAQLRLQEVCRAKHGGSGKAVTEVGMLEENAQKLGDKYAFHQQGQFYGTFAGEVVFTEDIKEKIVAAPGTYKYHGEAWKGLKDPMAKQAAYWVPISVTVRNSTGKEGTVKVLKFLGQKHWVDKSFNLKAGETKNVEVIFVGGEDAYAKFVFGG